MSSSPSTSATNSRSVSTAYDAEVEAEANAAATAAAAAELDGNRPRKINPLTIIQVKNPEKNYDDGGCGSRRGRWRSSGKLYYISSAFTSGLGAMMASRGRKCCTLSTGLCLLVSVSLFLCAMPCENSDGPIGPNGPDASIRRCGVGRSAMLPSAIQQYQRQWTQVFDDIGQS